MTVMERYSRALKKIGTDKLLALPDELKEALGKIGNLETKTELFEMIAEGIEKGLI